MYKKKRFALALLLILSLFLISACSGNSSDSADKDIGKHQIEYPKSYKTDEAGASSYDGSNDTENSPYFKKLDFYNMESKDSLTIIPKFKTYQQTTEYSCGPASAVMVLEHFGEYNKDTKDEMTIANISGTSDTSGVGAAGLAAYFTSIGWNVESSQPGKATFDSETATDDFKKWVLKNLKKGHPIMVGWLDWSGHWQVIIGYDTMGTEDNFGDDVLIMADAYDTTDHYQDGYFVVGAERFFYQWKLSLEPFIGAGHGDPQPWVIAYPKKK